jgi:hypothetical protein
VAVPFNQLSCQYHARNYQATPGFSHTPTPQSLLTTAHPSFFAAGSGAQFNFQQQSSPLRGQGVPSANVSDGGCKGAGGLTHRCCQAHAGWHMHLVQKSTPVHVAALQASTSACFWIACW